MDLAAARSGDAAAVSRERSRFLRSLQPLLQHEGPKLLVTDSQVRGVEGLCVWLCTHVGVGRLQCRLDTVSANWFACAGMQRLAGAVLLGPFYLQLSGLWAPALLPCYCH
jgi:hypothetical protein